MIDVLTSKKKFLKIFQSIYILLLGDIPMLALYGEKTSWLPCTNSFLLLHLLNRLFPG